MKIGYVLKRYPRISETFIVREILGLEAAGIDTHIYPMGFPEESHFHPLVAQVRGPVTYLPRPEKGLEEALQIVRERPAAFEAVMAFLDRIDPRYRVGLLVRGAHLARNADRDGVDHLHAHFMTIASHTAHIAHLFTGIPYSVTAHAKDIFRRDIDREVFNVVAEAATSLITVSDYNVAFVRSQLLDGRSVNVRRVYNGLPLPPPPKGDRDPNLLLAVGRLVPKKGFDHLIDALAELPPALHLVVIGDGELRAELERHVSDRGLTGRVRFLGVQPSDVVGEWMARAWCLVAPFRVAPDGNQDALPTVLIEALAAGLPVVAADVGGVPEIIDHGITGMVVPSADTTALVDAVRRIVSDRLLHRRMSQAGPQVAAERFSSAMTIPQWLEAAGPMERAS